MKGISHAILAAGMLGLTGCSSVKVAIDYDPSAVRSIAGYGTYAWLDHTHPEGGHPRIHNSIVAARIQRAVNAQLRAKGFHRVNHGTPDFRIGWHGSLARKIDVSVVNSYYGYGYDFWATGAGNDAGVYIREYDAGTIILDVVDAPSNELVWRGSAQTDLNRDSSPEERERKIDGAMQKLLRDFPPEPGDD